MDSGTILLLLAVALLLAWLYRQGMRNKDYFADKPIRYIPPTFMLGNSGGLFLKKYSMPEFVQKLYNTYPDAKIFGVFDTRRPAYLVRDPKMLVKIMIKDFEHFVDHRSRSVDMQNKKYSLFANSLLVLDGADWRDMRTTLTPAFTGSKMRQMFDHVAECAADMTLFIRDSQQQPTHEIRELFQRFTNDVIASAAFGVRVNSFADEQNVLYSIGKRLVDFQRPILLLKFFLLRLLPSVARRFKIDFIDSDISKYFRALISEAMERRADLGIVRNDMINILMQLKNGNALQETQNPRQLSPSESFAVAEGDERSSVGTIRTWNDTELIAQALIFYLAGFDTVSICLMFMTYELMINQDVQQNLYEEVKLVNSKLAGRRIDYDTIQEMKYMDMVVSETLRKWPPAAVTDRLCVKDYMYDDGEGLKFQMKKGENIWIPIYGLHHDSNYYPEPDRFNPERFSAKKRTDIINGTFMPFGMGPRNCIGSRFALMEIKLLMFHLLLNFSFEVCEQTTIPVRLVKSAIGLNVENGMWTTMKARK